MRVVIVQTSTAGYISLEDQFCREFGVTWSKMIVLLPSFNRFVEETSKGAMLVICGTSNGFAEPAVEYLSVVKQKNPSITVVAYVDVSQFGAFEGVVDHLYEKGVSRSRDTLVPDIRKYIETGVFRRSP